MRRLVPTLRAPTAHWTARPGPREPRCVNMFAQTVAPSGNTGTVHGMARDTTELPTLLTYADLAKITGYTQDYLRRLKMAGDLPPVCSPPDRHPRWHPEDVARWIAENRRKAAAA